MFFSIYLCLYVSEEVSRHPGRLRRVQRCIITAILAQSRWEGQKETGKGLMGRGGEEGGRGTKGRTVGDERRKNGKGGERREGETGA